MAIRRLPEQTVAARPTDPVTFKGWPETRRSGDSLGVWRYSDGYLVADRFEINRFRAEDGQWQCGWSSPTGSEIRSTPVLCQTSVLLCDDTTLTALFAQTLGVNWQIDIGAIANAVGLSRSAEVRRMGPAYAGGVWVLVQDDSDARLLEINEDFPSLFAVNKVTQLNWEATLDVSAIAGLAEGVVVAVEGGLIALPLTGVGACEPVSMKLHQKADRLWPSPDGRHAIVTGQGAMRISAVCLSQATKSLELSLALEGMFVPAIGERAGGWLFWDKEDPKVQGAAPLYDVGVAWTPDGAVAACGTHQGEAALLEPAAGVGIKMMVPPGAPIFPVAFDSPDGLYATSGNGAFRLVMDWTFGKAEATLSNDGVRNGQDDMELPRIDDSDESGFTNQRIVHKNPPAWLIPAAFLALAAAYGLIRWLGL